MSEEQLVLLEMVGVTPAQFELLQSFLGIFFVLTLFALVLTPLLARRKHLNAGFWTLMVLLFGPFALLAVLFVPAKPPLSEPQP